MQLHVGWGSDSAVSISAVKGLARPPKRQFQQQHFVPVRAEPFAVALAELLESLLGQGEPLAGGLVLAELPEGQGAHGVGRTGTAEVVSAGGTFERGQRGLWVAGAQFGQAKFQGPPGIPAVQGRAILGGDRG